MTETARIEFAALKPLLETVPSQARDGQRGVTGPCGHACSAIRHNCIQLDTKRMYHVSELA